MHVPETCEKPKSLPARVSMLPFWSRYRGVEIRNFHFQRIGYYFPVLDLSPVQLETHVSWEGCLAPVRGAAARGIVTVVIHENIDGDLGYF